MGGVKGEIWAMELAPRPGSAGGRADCYTQAEES